MSPVFVFYDYNKRRLPKIKKIVFSIFSFGILSLFLVLFSFFYTPLIGEISHSDLNLDKKPLIDEISERDEELIEVTGEGPFISLEKKENGNFLVRKPIKNEKSVMLTFDDGPDPTYTPKLLEILRNEDVKAVFFLVGEQIVRHPKLVEQINKEGHLIGVHTYSHPNPESVNLYDSLGKFVNRIDLEIDITQKIMISQSGIKSNIFRVPHWGAEQTIEVNSLILSVYALDRGYMILTPTIDSHDWYEKDSKKVIENSFDTNHSPVILFHDAGGDRNAMLIALPEIIKKYKKAGYKIVTADAFSQPVYSKATVFEKIISYVTYQTIWLKYNFFNLIKVVFLSALGIVGVTTLLTLTFALTQVFFKKRKQSKYYFPKLSVVIPAFNEESTIVKTVKSIKSSNYPDFEVIVVNNNSTDKTVECLRSFSKRKQIRLLNEKTQGKYAALNKGIRFAKGEIIVVIDADTQLFPDTLKNLVQSFIDRKVGAVAGSVHVGNVKNFWTYFQAIEYVASLNLDRRAYDLFSTTAVIPGALGAWRKDLIVRAGFYTSDTLTEDSDLAIRIQRLGYKTAYAANAIGYTEAPETLSQLLRQRQRWTFGILQVLYKNRDMLFKRKYGFLGTILLPYMVYVQLPTMLLTPFFDVLSIIALTIEPDYVATFFVFFLLIKFTEVLLAFVLANERRFSLLICIPYMRIVYQCFWYFNLYRCIFNALKGEYIPWNKMSHIGTVEIEKAVI